ncbi:MAG: hypothetical protein IMZ61_06375 [Planctomycetes bacterium]|nr:hypothetical protein [Thermoplasmata archaeon]MBE3143532.1 hypothetical protein [Planctomycetota bacterium]
MAQNKPTQKAPAQGQPDPQLVAVLQMMAQKITMIEQALGMGQQQQGGMPPQMQQRPPMPPQGGMGRPPMR